MKTSIYPDRKYVQWNQNKISEIEKAEKKKQSPAFNKYLAK